MDKRKKLNATVKDQMEVDRVEYVYFSNVVEIENQEAINRFELAKCIICKKLDCQQKHKGCSVCQNPYYCSFEGCHVPRCTSEHKCSEDHSFCKETYSSGGYSILSKCPRCGGMGSIFGHARFGF